MNDEEKEKRKNIVLIPNPSVDLNLPYNLKAKHKRTNSTSSNLSVVDLNESDKDNWNFFSSTQNLVSVLNDPNISRNVSEHIFTKDWGSYFVDTVQIPSTVQFPKLTNKTNFDNFIKDLNNREKFEKNCIQNHSKKFFDQDINSKKNESVNLENLIPSIFLKEDFKLENLDTFKEIFFEENNLLVNESNLKLNHNSIKQSIKELEKKLTDHLDVVEENLAKQISVRFRDFFHIMSAMELVMEQLNKTIREVTSVRKNCDHLQKTLVNPSLKNIQLTKKKANLQSVYEKIRIMSTVHETHPTIQNFLSTSDYVGALDLIAATQEVYNQELNGLVCFRHLNSQLTEIKKVIIQIMKDEFVKFLTQEWNRPFTKLEIEIKKNSFNENLNFEKFESFNFDKEKLSCMIIGMLKVERFEFIETFKDEACTTIKASIKQTIIEALSNEDSIVFKSNLPFEQLNELDFHRWAIILNEIFENLYIVLKRIQTIFLVIEQTVNNLDDKSNKSNHSDSFNFFDKNIDSDESHKAKEKKVESNYNKELVKNNSTSELMEHLNNCLYKVCNFCHISCSEIINSRTKENFFYKVTFDDFANLIIITDKFTSWCESICSKNILQLKLILRAQTNKYVTKFHEERKKSILSLLEIEQWKPIENISEDFQKVVTDLIDYNCSFTELHKSRKKQVLSSKNPKSLKHLTLNGEKFVIVYTIVEFVYTIIEYCSISAEIKSIAPDLLTRLSDLFKEFNSKIMQLVLLAEALQISGLKSITSRHLVVVNRNLKIVLILLPYVKNHFASLIATKNKPMLRHFDEIKESYIQHIQNNTEKIIQVVNDVLVAKINKWEAKPPVPSTEFKEITIHLQRLYSNIEEALPEEELKQILFEVHNSFTNLLKEQIIKLKIMNDGGPQHGLVTQELTIYKESLKFFKNENLSWDNIWCRS